MIQFHKGIQIFAVALHHLKNTVDENTVDVSIVEKRNELIKEITQEMRAVMCELESVVNHTCKHFVVDRIPLNYLEQFSSKWISSTDLTKMCIQDRGVLHAYNSFIKGYRYVLRRIKKESNNSGKKNDKQQNTTMKTTKKRKPKQNTQKTQQQKLRQQPTKRRNNNRNKQKIITQIKQRENRRLNKGKLHRKILRNKKPKISNSRSVNPN